MEYYGNIIAVTVADLTSGEDPVMSCANYAKLQLRGRLNVLRPGKGYGSYALIEYASLPERFKIRFVEKYGKPEDIMKKEQAGLPQDQEAQRFFYNHILPNGEHLPEPKQEEYTINARVLNALQDMFNTQKAMRRACNNNTPVIWSNIFKASEELRDIYHHTLPKSEARLRDKLREYAKEGYACLVSGKFGNANTIKITKAGERQIIALRRSKTPVYTIAQLFEEYNRIAEKKGWKPLKSENSLRQLLERPDIKPQWYDAIYGELASKQLYSRHN